MGSTVLQPLVQAHFSSHAAEFDLIPDAVRAKYILNWGGFANQSFRITDGRKQLHVKLAGNPEDRAALRRWQALHALLETRYHAPPMLGWAAIPGTPFAGPVFAWVDGAAPAEVPQGLLAELLPVISQLHSDEDLARRLSPHAPAMDCAQTYLATLDRRFRGDLEGIAAAPPTFLSPELLAWMQAEAARLAGSVQGSAAFQEPARSPIHGDLTASNLLVTASGNWYLLDWDDLTLGDPPLDLITLLGPSPANLRAHRWRDLPPEAVGSPALRERLELYERAQLLDWVIDPLADWVEAVAAPQHMAEVRPAKECLHRQALALYRKLYA